MAEPSDSDVQQNKLIVKMNISSNLSLRLKMEAKRRGVDRDKLIAEIITAVTSDDLFAAVLDR